MATLYDNILQGVIADVAAREEVVPFKEIKRLSRNVAPARDALSVLQQPGCCVIAEIKRADPVTNLVSSIRDTAAFARLCEQSGACIIGCQTEERRFNGALEDVRTVKETVRAPVWCKSFIVDPYQVHEARYYGADLVALQVAALEQDRLVALLDRVHSLGMEAIVEVADEEEASRGIQAGARVIGVDARDMRSRTLDRKRFATIAPGLPTDVVKVALSGVTSPVDLMRYAGAGADAVVVGEALSRSASPDRLCRSLVAAGMHPACPTAR
ncbi:indole-3-glycerol phosphate synthase TrpC [Corynebacterium pyruviciproducens]|mgnify:CR=1 FL=1|uniref:indole-3-glycerol-phosphate synthase n=1 Tax=Corynebacterium pyruviciproducens TaxID=598660 RepID=A0AAF0YRX5_9CORY|nr:indole-3-glycerol phosphate synthase TrpC [Corynebacterium pyruviciproducens]MDK7214453.1 indole-3-glycerol phosphate synthase TrpC [Corynebacterium pyruviciproducens]WOT03027.1 indole-3-glycerol phosphate synthase TrpC [Corynebacterium pyruviciproducens]